MDLKIKASSKAYFMPQGQTGAGFRLNKLLININRIQNNQQDGKICLGAFNCRLKGELRNFCNRFCEKKKPATSLQIDNYTETGDFKIINR